MTWRAERLTDALYGAARRPDAKKDSPQNIESTLEHWQHMLALRAYSPSSIDEQQDGRLRAAQNVSYDWLDEYDVGDLVGEESDGQLEYVRHRTYNMVLTQWSSERGSTMIGSRLLYFQTPAAKSSVHNVRMLTQPHGDARNPQLTQLVHFEFGICRGVEANVHAPVARAWLRHRRATWCGECVLRTRDGATHFAFWRRLSTGRAPGADVVFDEADRCTCAVPFAMAFVLRERDACYLIRLYADCSLAQAADGAFVFRTLTKTMTFVSLLRCCCEPTGARVVLDPFFASPFSRWLVYCTHHCLWWRPTHDSDQRAQAFVDDFLSLTQQHSGDALQAKLQEAFPVHALPRVESIPLVATNPPFFGVQRAMFERLFAAQDVVVLCSETDRTTRMMASFGMRRLDFPVPSNSFVFFRNGSLSRSRPSVRIGLRYWTRSDNASFRVFEHSAIRFDDLLNEMLILAIEADGLAKFETVVKTATTSGAKKRVRTTASKILAPDQEDLVRIRRSERPCLEALKDVLDTTRTRRIFKLTALYYVRQHEPEVIVFALSRANVIGPFWSTVQSMASMYWNAIDATIVTYPALIATHYDTIRKEPEDLRKRSLAFFTLGIPNVEEIEKTILDPSQVDRAIYDPIRQWFLCLEEVERWLSEPLTMEEKEQLNSGLATLRRLAA